MGVPPGTVKSRLSRARSALTGLLREESFHLARMGWEIHAIATFAGHRHTDSTLQYIHLSGRDLADKLAAGMQHIHAWRVAMLTDAPDAAG